MKVEVHILAYEEERILPYTIRHYRTFADRVIVHDAHSPDGTERVSLAAGAEVQKWGLGGEVNDEEYCALKNSCWLGTNADWVIVCDADEMLYFPRNARATLETYLDIGAAVIKPHGFEMFSPTWPTTEGQIYSEVKMGAPDDKWYSKPILWNANIVADSGLGMGSHESMPVLKNGDFLNCGKNWLFPDPPCYLLHFHQVGPAERIAARYDAIQTRMSHTNKAHRWGNFKPGLVHVQEKRDYIIPNLRQVVT
jgi:glycosyltransferase involved in cell wall biosynthesis